MEMIHYTVYATKTFHPQPYVACSIVLTEEEVQKYKRRPKDLFGRYQFLIEDLEGKPNRFPWLFIRVELESKNTTAMSVEIQ